jgi:hypothetical protein
LTIFPLLVEAFSVVIPDVPPIFKTPVVPCVKPPAPDKAVVALKVPLFVYVPVNVDVGIDVTVNPLNDVPVPLNV